MQFKLFFLCLYFCVLVRLSACKKNNGKLYKWTLEPPENPVNIIRGFGYPAEEHEVITEDGYILTLHRIPNNKPNKQKRLPVLLLHGIACSSGDYINISPNVSLGYALYDSGYDVWMGNARGNSYSRKHISIDWKTNPKSFYNFSFHEMGKYDLPAMIDYVLNKTNEKQIQFIGHSQGGTTLYVAMSIRPEYNEKIRLVSLLAPGGFFNKLPHPFYKLFALFEKQIQALADALQIYRIPFVDVIRNLMKKLCQEDVYFPFCRMLLSLAGAGFSDNAQLNKEILVKLLRTTPSDVSIKQAVHYLQEIQEGRFCQYDYGETQNLRIYGSVKPPEYDLTKITVPIAIYYGENDIFMSVSDIRKIIGRLPNIVYDYLIPYKDFNHGDFLWAKDLYNLLTKRLLTVMERY